jgi:hypothetical protein
VKQEEEKEQVVRSHDNNINQPLLLNESFIYNGKKVLLVPLLPTFQTGGCDCGFWLLK